MSWWKGCMRWDGTNNEKSLDGEKKNSVSTVLTQESEPAETLCAGEWLWSRVSMWNIRRRVKIWASQVTEDHEDHTMKTMGHHLFIYVCVWRGGGGSGEYYTGRSQWARAREQVFSSFLTLLLRGQGSTRMIMAPVPLRSQDPLVCNQTTCACLSQSIMIGLWIVGISL